MRNTKLDHLGSQEANADNGVKLEAWAELTRWGKTFSAADQIERLVDGWVDDILALSDEEVLTEARESGEDPEAIAEEMRALVRTLLVSPLEGEGKPLATTPYDLNPTPPIEGGQ